MKILCKEVYSVATDLLQVAAQNLNFNLYLNEPVDLSGYNHLALRSNIERLLVMHDIIV